jgi:hypothetical protein
MPSQAAAVGRAVAGAADPAAALPAPPPPAPVDPAACAALFASIFARLKADAETPEGQARIRSFATCKGDTQQSERRSIEYITSVLQTLGVTYEHAGSQQPKDLRNVGGIGLSIEIKTSNGTTSCLNDTAPQPGIWYVFFHTTNPNSRRPTRLPQVVACEGSMMIERPEEKAMVAALSEAIAKLRTLYGKGEARRWRLNAFPRCNYQYKFDHLLTSLPTKADLCAELCALGLPTGGTREALEERLRKANAAAAAPAPAASV